MSRAAYYAALPEYYHLEELRGKLLANETESSDIIEFIKNQKLSVNSYIKGTRSNEWVPLLHLCCRHTKYQSVVKFLLKSGADINLLSDADHQQMEPLLFGCDEIYFKYLVNNGCILAGGDQKLNIKRRLRCSDIKRLRQLVKVKQINISDVLSSDTDPVLYCLTSMKDYLIYAFNIRTGSNSNLNLTAELNETIAKFLSCVVQLLEWGASVTKEADSFAINHYMFEFLSLPGFSRTGVVPYHEHMDGLKVAMLRPLLNDARYEKTCLLVNQKPCEDLWISRI
jgi:hypothetical protein